MFQSTNNNLYVYKFIAFVGMKFLEYVTYVILHFFSSAEFASVILANHMFLSLV
jgi:hypothetical protein